MSRDRLTSRFAAAATAAEVVAGTDLRGRQMIVTGGSSGFGFETARALASAGAAVTLAVPRPGGGAASPLRSTPASAASPSRWPRST